MNRIAKFLLAAVLAAAASGAALAQSHICAYVNDNLQAGGAPNTVDGYNVTGTTATYIAPVATTGVATGYGTFNGGTAGMRARKNDLYIGSDGSRTIGHLTINPSDCSLTYDKDYSDGDKASPQGDDPFAITPNGKFMYVANNGTWLAKHHVSNIQLIKIAANGSLKKPVAQNSVGSLVTGLAVSGDGNLLAASLAFLEEVCLYTIASDGSLGANPSCSSTVPSGSGPTGLAFDKTATCLYVGEGTSASNEVAAAAVSGTSLGAFTNYTNLGGGANSQALALSASGNLLYISDDQTSQITTASVGSGCALSPDTVSSFGMAGNDFPSQIAVSGTTVFIVDYNNDDGFTVPALGLFQALGNGELKSLTGGNPLHPLTTVQLANPVSVAIVPESSN
jgi:hypothetical protein